uniref:Uncharacterized protein n=1 Tax=Arundo donax TaxID=35708 RepID=A0A0A9H6U1_ARUDO
MTLAFAQCKTGKQGFTVWFKTDVWRHVSLVEVDSSRSDMFVIPCVVCRACVCCDYDPLWLPIPLSICCILVTAPW